MGIRAIAEVKGIHNSLVSYWIRQFAKIVKEKIELETKQMEIQNIEIVEVDELCTYIKKNLNLINKQGSGMEGSGLGFGLLLIGTKTKLLILR
jgi:hypothetical protein